MPKKHTLHNSIIAHNLYDAGLIFASLLERDNLLDQMLAQTQRIIPYHAACIVLFENGMEMGRGHIVRQTGFENLKLSGANLEKTTFAINKIPLMSTLAETKQPVISTSIAALGWGSSLESLGIHSVLSAPLMIQDEIIGFFSLQSTTPDFYDDAYLALITLIARQVAIALENARLFSDLQELEHSKSMMIRIASHDLSGPLTRITESLKNIQEQVGSSVLDQQQKYFHWIQEAIQDMEHIVTHILSLERIEAQHQATKPINWFDLVSHCIEEIRFDLEDKQHALTFECDPNLPTTRGEPVQLQHAILNLFDNAIKYTPPGGSIAVQVYVKRYGDEDKLALEIKDTGIGLSIEQQKKLFQPFYRAEQAGTDAISGSGLGLSIVKNVIDYHHGRVYVDSEPGVGSLFGFWLPI